MILDVPLTDGLVNSGNLMVMYSVIDNTLKV